MSTAYPAKAPSSASVFRESPTLSRNRPDNIHPILIIEDDDLMRVSLEDRFRLEGFAVATAATLDGARRELANGPRPNMLLAYTQLTGIGADGNRKEGKTEGKRRGSGQ